jgi:hypothetical protein
MNIIDIASRRPHLAGDAKCLKCKHEWQAISPVGATDLECPECKLYKGVFMGNCSPKKGDKVWTCHCGCDVFTIYTHEIRCLNCGLPQIGLKEEI